jgi:hypothetical protein
MKPFPFAASTYVVLVGIALAGGLAFAVWRSRSPHSSTKAESSLDATELLRRSRAQAAADPALLGIDFGDQVRVREASETTAAGIAGLEGSVLGFTRPSVTNVDVIGGAPNDRALVVDLGAPHGQRWFRPDLLILLHQNPGAVVTFDDTRGTRRQGEDGS